MDHLLLPSGTGPSITILSKEDFRSMCLGGKNVLVEVKSVGARRRKKNVWRKRKQLVIYEHLLERNTILKIRQIMWNVMKGYTKVIYS